MSNKLSNEEYIERVTKVHGDTYDYTETKYVSANTRVRILCKQHGEFIKIPSVHEVGSGCPECTIEVLRKGKEDKFISKVDKWYKGEYSVIKGSYITARHPCQIRCEKHLHTFSVLPSSVKGITSCPVCKLEEEFDIFKDKAYRLHKEDYSYGNSRYLSSRDYLEIQCNSCNNAFLQRPSAHLQGQGCPDCARQKVGESNTKSIEDYEELLRDNKYKHKIVFESFTKATENIDIQCDKHGKSTLTAVRLYSDEFILNKDPCLQCREEKTTSTRESTTLIKVFDAIELEDNSTFVSMDNFENNRSKVTLDCKIHSTFKKRVDKLLAGQTSCQECSKSKIGRWSQKTMEPNRQHFESQVCSLYMMEVESATQKMIKIGFSVDTGSRISQLKLDCNSYYTFNTLATYTSNTYNCSGIEKYIHKHLKSYKVKPDRWFGGYTECFSYGCIDTPMFNSLIEEYNRKNND